MTPVLVFASLLATPAVAGPPAQPAERAVVVAGPAVRISDLFSLTDVAPPLRAKAGALILFNTSDGATPVRIDEAQAWRRAVALAPVLSEATAPAPGRTLVIHRQRTRPETTVDCVQLRVATKRGAYPLEADFAPADCLDKASAPAFSLEPRLGLVRASRDLYAGEIVQAPPRTALASVEAGRKVMIETRIGAVVLQREADIVRPVRPGAAAVVRTRDGAVFVAPISEDAP